jgi:hypothetical protein
MIALTKYQKEKLQALSGSTADAAAPLKPGDLVMVSDSPLHDGGELLRRFRSFECDRLVALTPDGCPCHWRYWHPRKIIRPVPTL